MTFHMMSLECGLPDVRVFSGCRIYSVLSDHTVGDPRTLTSGDVISWQGFGTWSPRLLEEQSQPQSPEPCRLPLGTWFPQAGFPSSPTCHGGTRHLHQDAL